MLHNLINKEMMNVDDLKDIDEGDSAYATIAGDDIHYIKNSNVDQMAGWYSCRDVQPMTVA